MLNEAQWKAIVAAHSLDEVRAIVDAAIRERVLETLNDAQPVAACDSTGTVYSHPSCTFNYCPNPEVCKALPKGCQHA